MAQDNNIVDFPTPQLCTGEIMAAMEGPIAEALAFAELLHDVLADRFATSSDETKSFIAGELKDRVTAIQEHWRAMFDAARGFPVARERITAIKNRLDRLHDDAVPDVG
jgi:hypothetical protein